MSWRDIFKNRPLMRRDVVYYWPLEQPPAVEIPEGQGITWEYCTQEILDRVFADDPHKHKYFSDALANDSFGVMIYVNGDWAAYCWMSIPGRPRPTHVCPRVARGTFWYFTGRTREQYRKMGLFKIMLEQLIVGCFDRDPKPLVIGETFPGNISRIGLTRIGLAEMGMLYRFYLWIPWVYYGRVYTYWNKREPHPPLPQKEPKTP